MRKFIPLFLILVGLSAVAAMVWILFDGTEYAPDLSMVQPPEKKEDPTPRVITHAPPESAGRQQDRELIPVDSDTRRQVEQLKPEHDSAFFSGAITLYVAYLKNRQPVDAEAGLAFQILFNGVPLSKAPQPTGEAGKYILQGLLPGNYGVHAHTPDWMMGAASCDLAPDTRVDLTLLIDSGDHLEIRISDAVTHEPVHNARLQAKGFIQGGTTDEAGSFKSARKFIPDADLAIEISHPCYFNQVFSPLEPDRSGAQRIGSGYKYSIELTPFNGDLNLSGTVSDETREPIQRLALFLSPEKSDPTRCSTTTYTNRTGYFNFSRLEPGRYRLRATMRFLASSLIQNPPCFFDQVYTLSPGQSLLDLKIECMLPRTSFSGFVYLARSYEPAHSATVSFESSLSGMRSPGEQIDPLAFTPVTTDDLGWFTTSETYLSEDIYRMIVYGNIKVTTKDGTTSFCRPRKTPEGLRQMQADILSAKPVTLWVVETNEKVLTGNVCDVTGSPVSGVRITADSEMDIAQGRLRAYTDENGFFQIANLFPGKWVISAMIPNGPALQRTIDIPMDTNPSPLTIRIENTCSIEGEILTDQEPGRMSIRVQGLDFETEAQKIGSKLWYSFQHLPPGRAQLILEVYDGRRYQECYLSVEEVWVDLEKGKVLRHDFSL